MPHILCQLGIEKESFETLLAKIVSEKNIVSAWTSLDLSTCYCVHSATTFACTLQWLNDVNSLYSSVAYNLVFDDASLLHMNARDACQTPDSPPPLSPCTSTGSSTSDADTEVHAADTEAHAADGDSPVVDETKACPSQDNLYVVQFQIPKDKKMFMQTATQLDERVERWTDLNNNVVYLKTSSLQAALTAVHNHDFVVHPVLVPTQLHALLENHKKPRWFGFY